MPATPSRRRAARVVALAFASVLVLGGCTQVQRAPKDYSGAEDNFLEGCIDVAQGDNGKAGDEGQQETTKIASPKTYCQCVFNAIEKKIPWSEFKQTQSTMQDEGGKIPSSFQKAYASCDPAETASSSSSGSGS